MKRTICEDELGGKNIKREKYKSREYEWQVQTAVLEMVVAGPRQMIVYKKGPDGHEGHPRALARVPGSLMSL